MNSAGVQPTSAQTVRLDDDHTGYTSAHHLRAPVVVATVYYVVGVSSPLTTKQPQPERLKDWYPYYAGFPAAFVDATIGTHFPEARSILDPWNGAGTTTAIAAERGLTSTGVEINPAVTIVARARLTPVSIADSLCPLADEIVAAAERTSVSTRDAEPLAKWLRAPAIEHVRRLQHAIHQVLTEDEHLELELASSPEACSQALGQLPSFYYSALFAAVRDLLMPFRASNPTWLRKPRTHRHRISPPAQAVQNGFLNRVQFLADRLTLTESTGTTRVVTGSAMKIDSVDEFDACLTSPPYATRVDYVMSSLAELALVGLDEDQIRELRQQTTGTPTVRGSVISGHELRSDEALRLVRKVAEHDSHGSANYYAQWIRNYFVDMEKSLSRICAAVRKSGSIGIVVQDSHYKEIRIDLQTVVTEAMEVAGRKLTCREDYSVRHSLAKMNPAARQHLACRENSESLLVFG